MWEFVPVAVGRAVGDAELRQPPHVGVGLEASAETERALPVSRAIVLEGEHSPALEDPRTAAEGRERHRSSTVSSCTTSWSRSTSADVERLAGVVFGDEVRRLSEWHAGTGTKSRYEVDADEAETRMESAVAAVSH
jgi:hypothetical protein